MSDSVLGQKQGLESDESGGIGQDICGAFFARIQYGRQQTPSSEGSNELCIRSAIILYMAWGEHSLFQSAEGVTIEE